MGSVSYKKAPRRIYCLRVITMQLKRTWKTYAVWILLSEAVGALSGFLTRNGAEQYSAAIT